MPRIRPAVAADLAAIQAIVAAAYGTYVPRIGRKPGPMLDDYAVRITAGQVHVLDADGDVLGLVVLIPRDDAMLLDNVAVALEARGEGHGRRLVAFAEQATHAAGRSWLKLYTHEAMHENLALYERLGFVETHRIEERGFRRVYLRKRIA